MLPETTEMKVISIWSEVGRSNVRFEIEVQLGLACIVLYAET